MTDMTINEGDTVYWRGHQSKVLAVRGSGLVLHVGEGRIIRDVTEGDYTVIAVSEPEPAAPVSTQKPKPTKPSAKAPIAKARRKVSTGKGKK